MAEVDAGKRDKASVGYSWSTGKDRCGVCDHFIEADRRCEKVKGEIDPHYWCKLFERKR